MGHFRVPRCRGTIAAVRTGRGGAAERSLARPFDGGERGSLRIATSVTTPAPRVGRPEGPPAGRPSTPAPAPAPAPPAGSGAARRAAEAPLGWIEQVAGMMVLTGKAMVATFTPPYSWRDEFIQESWLILRRCLVPMVVSVVGLSNPKGTPLALNVRG